MIEGELKKEIQYKAGENLPKRGQNLFKKSLIGAVLIVGGFTIRDIRGGEEFYLVDSLQMFILAFLIGIFVQWTMIPHDWNKNKKKQEDKKNLS